MGEIVSLRLYGVDIGKKWNDCKGTPRWRTCRIVFPPGRKKEETRVCHVVREREVRIEEGEGMGWEGSLVEERSEMRDEMHLRIANRSRWYQWWTQLIRLRSFPQWRVQLIGTFPKTSLVIANLFEQRINPLHSPSLSSKHSICVSLDWTMIRPPPFILSSRLTRVWSSLCPRLREIVGESLPLR